MRPVSVRSCSVLRRLLHCGKSVRIAVWCVALLYLLFFLSDFSYQLSVRFFARERTEHPVSSVNPALPDSDGVRAKADMKLVWETDDAAEEVSAWLSFPPGETAGMNEEEFAAYLEAYPLPGEMVERGLTDIRLKAFRGYEAVISVGYARKDCPRYRYFCRAQSGRLRVCDVSGQTLVLEQALEKSGFSFAQLRRLSDGIYLEDYEAVVRLIKGTGE